MSQLTLVLSMTALPTNKNFFKAMYVKFNHISCCVFAVWPTNFLPSLFQCNDLSCTCVSGNKRWLATADKGKDSMIIVWDSYTRQVDPKMLQSAVLVIN